MSKLERFMRIGNPKLVLEHIGRIRKPEVIALALDHRSSGVRMNSASRLGKIAGPEFIPTLQERLKSEKISNTAEELVFAIEKIRRRKKYGKIIGNALSLILEGHERAIGGY
ncbi:MAG TPA: HEAT repeat domain-containing protein [Candidatus Norongarragalinales archaeon]|jgi:HEAT repeat protein|nr:HEAT repeat domain-containing protein [Candidatus Norongarragalinales archaeon]